MTPQSTLINRLATQAYNTNKARLRLIEAKRMHKINPTEASQMRVNALESEINGAPEPEVLEFKIQCLINNN